MSARITRTQIVWLALLFALSFAVAGCAAEQGAGPESSRGRAGSGQSASGRGSSATSEGTQGASGAAMAPQAPRASGSRTALGETVEVRQAWVQVRSKPSADARAIALAFGNDTYPVVGREGDWVRVKIDRNREGWLPLEATGSR